MASARPGTSTEEERRGRGPPHVNLRCSAEPTLGGKRKRGVPRDTLRPEVGHREHDIWYFLIRSRADVDQRLPDVRQHLLDTLGCDLSLWICSAFLSGPAWISEGAPPTASP
ncbi:unnamed protein product [Prorocentrum cordatum]|uniref:Uncharacterized protein n=1 Tax=Prorocentrum cordatum TaxID=2364126 RepID=A0ABN9X680_9DINO|nr:unnamed protein product [Polarella glacialis]